MRRKLGGFSLGWLPSKPQHDSLQNRSRPETPPMRDRSRYPWEKSRFRDLPRGLNFPEAGTPLAIHPGGTGAANFQPSTAVAFNKNLPSQLQYANYQNSESLPAATTAIRTWASPAGVLSIFGHPEIGVSICKRLQTLRCAHRAVDVKMLPKIYRLIEQLEPSRERLSGRLSAPADRNTLMRSSLATSRIRGIIPNGQTNK